MHKVSMVLLVLIMVACGKAPRSESSDPNVRLYNKKVDEFIQAMKNNSSLLPLNGYPAYAKSVKNIGGDYEFELHDGTVVKSDESKNDVVVEIRCKFT